MAKPKVIQLYRFNSSRSILDLFLFEKRAEGRAPRTIQDYEEKINAFFKKFPYALRSEKDLRHAVLSYFAEEMRSATFNLRRAYLKAFFSFLVREGAIAKNPIDFPRRKDEGRARAVPEEALRKLLEACNKKTFAGFRDYCLVLLILDTGTRPGEALRLKREDFDFASLEMTIPAEIAKTRRKRTLPLSPVVAKEIKKLLSLHPPEWRSTPVFCSYDGKELSERALAHRFKKYSQRIGHEITPYDLRHTFALFSLRNGMSPFALQRILGHADLSMTKRYLALTGEDLKREHEKATPIHEVVRKRVGKVEG